MALLSSAAHRHQEIHSNARTNLISLTLGFCALVMSSVPPLSRQRPYGNDDIAAALMPRSMMPPPPSRLLADGGRPARDATKAAIILPSSGPDGPELKATDMARRAVGVPESTTVWRAPLCRCCARSSCSTIARTTPWAIYSADPLRLHLMSRPNERLGGTDHLTLCPHTMGSDDGKGDSGGLEGGENGNPLLLQSLEKEVLSLRKARDEQEETTASLLAELQRRCDKVIELEVRLPVRRRSLPVRWQV